MKKAERLMGILTKEYKRSIPKKYAMIILKIAALEERSKTLMDFGMVDMSKDINRILMELLEQTVIEYKNEKKGRR